MFYVALLSVSSSLIFSFFFFCRRELVGLDETFRGTDDDVFYIDHDGGVVVVYRLFILAVLRFYRLRTTVG